MKIAAARALAALAREPAPDGTPFGPDRVFPGPFDPRLIETAAPAVARVAN